MDRNEGMKRIICDANKPALAPITGIYPATLISRNEDTLPTYSLRLRFNEMMLRSASENTLPSQSPSNCDLSR